MQTPAPSIAPDPGGPVVRAITLTKFTQIRLDAAMRLRAAFELPGLPAHYRQQIDSAIHLLELRLHRVIGEAEGNDALGYRDDLEAICERVADPLVAAIGEDARFSVGIKVNDVDLHFTDQLSAALDGNAAHILEERAREIEAERRERSARVNNFTS